MNNQRFYVITGASGAGKSTLIEALSDLGYATVPEAARSIVQEQRARDGSILPSIDRPAFMEEVLARSIEDHRIGQSQKAPVFFDRGIPEYLAWLRRTGLSVKPHHLAAAEHRYADTVFLAEPWPEVYVNDLDRHASFERAARSYEPTVAAYVETGYRTCIIPKVSVQERVAFILSTVEAGA